MTDFTKHIDLPSGGWWEITTRPLWRHLRTWSAAVRGPVADRGLVMAALATLTTAWSFDEGVSAESLDRRETEDLVAMLEVFQREVGSNLVSDSPSEMAESLFAGMLKGRIPAEFADVSLMAATGWSWHALEATPADVVQRMAIYLAVHQARETGDTLDFPDTVEG